MRVVGRHDRDGVDAVVAARFLVEHFRNVAVASRCIDSQRGSRDPRSRRIAGKYAGDHAPPAVQLRRQQVHQLAEGAQPRVGWLGPLWHATRSMLKQILHGRHLVMKGLLDREKILGPERVREGDALVGIPSTGLHTNGYSLARQVLFDAAGWKHDTFVSELGMTVGDALLAPHRSSGAAGCSRGW